MGVPGLWDLLQHTAEIRSLTHLAVVDGFEKNLSGLRGYRLGIDASIWFFHAKSGREGENPELRLIFFRLAKLLSEPILPVFVFDGPRRPKWKRGIRISSKPHWMLHAVKTMINAFGYEWVQAPGEAEAELAYMNRVGAIDAILSDDVDNFLFGAKVVIRNPGRGLTGNLQNPALNSEGKDDGNHVRIFDAAKFVDDETVGLTRGGFILIGLLSGGDYEEKDVPGSTLRRCGIRIAHALARCGFGDQLVEAVETMSPAELDAYLVDWRNDLREELRTNSRKLLSRREARLADSLPDEFPSLAVLKAYVQPVTSESEGKPLKQLVWPNEHSLAELARFCEDKFEWGTMLHIPKRFRSLLWHGSVIRIIRRATLDLDHRALNSRTSHQPKHVRLTERPLDDNSDLADIQKRRVISSIPQTPTKFSRSKQSSIPSTSSTSASQRGDPIGTPSKMIRKYFSLQRLPSSSIGERGDDSEDDDNEDSESVLLSTICASTTSHASNDGILEYRVEINPTQLVKLTQSGIQGTRDELPLGSDGEDEVEGGEDGDDNDEPAKKTTKRKPKFVDPYSSHRIWVPGSMLAMVEQDLVAGFEEAQAKKKAKKNKAGMKRTGSKTSVGRGKVSRRKGGSPLSDSEADAEEEIIPMVIVPEVDESDDGDDDFDRLMAGKPLRKKKLPTSTAVRPPMKVPLASRLRAGPSKSLPSLPDRSSSIAKPPPSNRASPARPPRSLVRHDSDDWEALFRDSPPRASSEASSSRAPKSNPPPSEDDWEALFRDTTPMPAPEPVRRTSKPKLTASRGKAASYGAQPKKSTLSRTSSAPISQPSKAKTKSSKLPTLSEFEGENPLASSSPTRRKSPRLSARQKTPPRTPDWLPRYSPDPSPTPDRVITTNKAREPVTSKLLTSRILSTTTIVASEVINLCSDDSDFAHSPIGGDKGKGKQVARQALASSPLALPLSPSRKHSLFPSSDNEEPEVRRDGTSDNSIGNTSPHTTRKSPRHSNEHTSPKHKPLPSLNGDLDSLSTHAKLTLSLTPQRKKSPTVIELSSDGTPPPRTLTRLQQSSKRGGTSGLGFQISKSKPQARKKGPVIDISP